MSHQESTPESERNKSGVKPVEDAGQRAAGFKEGNKVKMKVEETLIDGSVRKNWKTFTIVAAQCPVSSWKYKLNDSKGVLYDGGKLFPETDLRPTS